jgi:tRNA-dihydrouridine synthase
MLFYFAPLEGITNYIYRNTYASYYKSVDKFFTPFLNTNVDGCLVSKSEKDIKKENNLDINIVPQLLTNNPNTFNIVATKLKNEGYNEINLNLGCPSGTVTSKKRGSGQLKDIDALKAFLDEIFNKRIQEISIKTRIGFSDPKEMEALLPLFNNYPLKELIVHPRVRDDFYKGPIHIDVFRDIVKESKNEVCYNGNLCTASQIKDFVKDFPSINKIMIGRGLIANPGLIEEFKTGKATSLEIFKEFHDSIYNQYSNILYGERSLLFKMKDHWKVWKITFPENSKEVKKILKSQNLSSYTKAVDSILNK